MLRLAANLIARVAPWSVLALGVAVPLATGAVPARAQDMFGFFKPYAPPQAQPLATLQPPSEGAPLTVRVRSRRNEARRNEARAEKPPVKATVIAMPLKPKDPSKIANPVPALLADGTLRSGDLVMFPGGLRVFTGRTGDDHALADFEPLAQSGKAVPATTRKLVAQLRPGLNSAWSADAVKAGGKLAMNTKGTETGGKAKPRSR
jgi:hypothetical protein